MNLEFSVSSFKKRGDLDKEWDVIIIGGGPAGLTSALYCGRYRLKTLVITKKIGGLLLKASVIEDYPGIKKISGKDLAELFKEHALEWGAKIIEDEVVDISKEGKLFSVRTKRGNYFVSRSIIFATGASREKLNIVNEDKFIGKGISYCAECDAPLFKDKDVLVIGEGENLIHEVYVLVRYARKVYVIIKNIKEFSEKIEKIKEYSNVEILSNKEIIKIEGDDRVDFVILGDLDSKEIYKLRVDGIFIAVDIIPVAHLAKKIGVEMDRNNCIKVDQCMRTNIPGVFAAGEVTSGRCKLNKIITVAAEGAIAALSVFKYINEIKEEG